MTITPLSLLERLRSSPDEDSWRRLVSLYNPWLQRVLRQAGISETDADDLRQEVLAVLFQEMPEFEHNGQAGAFRRWMRNIVINRVRRYWRSRRTAALRQPGDVSWDAVDDSAAGLEEYWDREHDRYLIEELFKLVEASVSRSTWLAFRRQAVDGERASAVASELGISVNAALLAKSRVLARLRSEGRLLLDNV
ncbi:MAG TPA: sigma-70 family RNA polymerase sigma factor [Pirellulales bacterium]|jgi:RNA polymerase sigma-70 factor (ECF subfamily)|nr:sigma-70 family RNA polymerase sigma factor [Pirellulales bacterium]